jgi:hypothetical protein
MRVYIPGGPGGAEDQPSDFYGRVKESLRELGIEPSWTFKYNAGAKPHEGIGQRACGATEPQVTLHR